MISIATIGIICGMLGATAVAFERPFYANVLWLIGNPLLIIHNYGIGETGQSAMFAYYIATALFGVAYHKYKKSKAILSTNNTFGCRDELNQYPIKCNFCPDTRNSKECKVFRSKYEYIQFQRK